MKSTEEILKGKRTNPGTFLDLNHKFTNISPLLFDGLKFGIRRDQSPHLQINHDFSISSSVPANYSLGDTFIGKQIISKLKEAPTVPGNLNVGGYMNISISLPYDSRCKLRYTGQTVNTGNSFATNQFEAHYLADSFSLSAVLANTKTFKTSRCLLLQYLQNISSNFDIGFELGILQRSNHSTEAPGSFGILPLPSVVGRFRFSESTMCAVVGINNLLLTYYHRLAPEAEYGFEIGQKLTPRETSATVSSKVGFQDMGLTVQTMIDSKLNIGVLVKKRISDHHVALTLSTQLQLRTSNVTCGLGVSID